LVGGGWLGSTNSYTPYPTTATPAGPGSETSGMPPASAMKERQRRLGRGDNAAQNDRRHHAIAPSAITSHHALGGDAAVYSQEPRNTTTAAVVIGPAAAARLR
jgi:hypothetical protein